MLLFQNCLSTGPFWEKCPLLPQGTWECQNNFVNTALIFTWYNQIQPLPLCTFQSKTLCLPISAFPSALPRVTQQVMTVTLAPTSQPLPGTPVLTRPAPETQSGQAVVEVASRPREDSQTEVFTTHPQTSRQDTSDQVNTENRSHPGDLCDTAKVLLFFPILAMLPE